MRKELFDDKNNVRVDVLPDRAGETIDTLGAKVRTTLDPSLQAKAQAALQAGLRAVDKRQHIGRPVRTLKSDKVEGDARPPRQEAAEGWPQGRRSATRRSSPRCTTTTRRSRSTSATTRRRSCSADEDARFNRRRGGKAPSERFKPGDVVEVSAPRPGKAKRRPREPQSRGAFAPGPRERS